AEPSLELDHTASQATRRTAKQGAFNACVVRTKGKRLEVKFVEHIKEVAAQFETGSFAEEPEAGQPKLLADAGVDVEIAGAAERVAADSRGTRVANIKVRRSLKRSVSRVAIKILHQAGEIGQRGYEIRVGSAHFRL